MKNDHFIPAFGHRRLTPHYDALCRLIGFGDRLRRFEVGLVEGLSPRRILEVGCGTAELTLALARRFPSAEVVGLDVDPEVLAIAQKKLEPEGGRAQVVPGRAEALPFPDAHFDLVASSLMLHHLSTPEKEQALREWRRVLAPGGTLLLVDFGPPRSRALRAMLWPLRLGVFEHVDDNLQGRIPAMLARAGFAAEEVGSYAKVLKGFRAKAAGTTPGRPA
ncbi:MAG: class I SAM-dependent methyltransferase [Myxococcaceae bacterium]